MQDFLEKSLKYPEDREVKQLLSQTNVVQYQFTDLFEELPEIEKFVRSSPYVRKLNALESNLQVLNYIKDLKDPSFAYMKHIIVVKTGFVTLCLTRCEESTNDKVTQEVTALFKMDGYDKVPKTTLGQVWNSCPTALDLLIYATVGSLLLSFVKVLVRN